MKEIQAEGIKFVYLTPSDGFPIGIVHDLEINKAPYLELLWDTIKADGLNDIRLVIVQYTIWEDIGNIRLLHWNNQVDLRLLDEKVRNGTFTDEDFESSVLTVFGKTKCFSCGWEGYTAVMFTADYYAIVPGLEARKVEERREKQGFKVCPNCGAKFTQLVVKIF
jgi:hypothetical protein